MEEERAENSTLAMTETMKEATEAERGQGKGEEWEEEGQFQLHSNKKNMRTSI